MTKLTRQELNDHLDRDWEDSFGVDYPEFLPYWVAYMDFETRNRYLTLVRSEVVDFDPKMLTKEFDWNKWEPMTPSIMARTV